MDENITTPAPIPGSGPDTGADPPKEEDAALAGPDELPAAQAKAVLALIAHPTIRQAADSAGVSERTLHRWLDEDARFIAAHRKARRQAFAHAISLAQQYAPLAVNAMAKIVADPASSPAAKVCAGASILKFARDAFTLDDLSARLERLERHKRERS